MKNLCAALCFVALTQTATADTPVIEHATATKSGTTWTISVTLSHPDTGWDDYADGWEVLAPDGTSLGVRVLAHPHVNEQPFTRSLSRIEIPNDLNKVMIRARDNVGGWGQASYTLPLPK